MTKPANILIVDDEPDMCWALRNTLRKEGYCITTVTTAREALARVQGGGLTAVIIDAKLPDMDGTDLAAQIRQTDSTPVLILLSGYFYPEDKVVVEGLQQGLYSAFISKPFSIKDVRSAVRKAIG